MSLLDPERTQKLVSSMRETVEMLHELSQMSKEEFLADKHRQSSAKYNFIAAIEAAIDLANHLISRVGFRSPEDYADTFKVLAEQGVIEKQFAEELVNMARFRNRLVHIYWDVNTNEIWRILQSRLNDFEQFRCAIAEFCK